MASKRSKHGLKRLVEEAVATVCGLPRPGLWFCVDEEEPAGKPPERIKVWATLHFLPEGSPFCCGEPGCHLWLFGDRLAAVGEHVRHAMRLRQQVSIEFEGIRAEYHPGIEFTTDMKKHSFTLILAGVTDLSSETASALYEATNGDIEFSIRNDLAVLEFVRAAPTLEGAISSAIQEVENANLGVRVVRVESDAANIVAKINASLLGDTK